MDAKIYKAHLTNQVLSQIFCRLLITLAAFIIFYYTGRWRIRGGGGFVPNRGAIFYKLNFLYFPFKIFGKLDFPSYIRH